MCIGLSLLECESNVFPKCSYGKALSEAGVGLGKLQDPEGYGLWLIHDLSF